jgi:hypothetical protein
LLGNAHFFQRCPLCARCSGVDLDIRRKSSPYARYIRLIIQQSHPFLVSLAELLVHRCGARPGLTTCIPRPLRIVFRLLAIPPFCTQIACCACSLTVDSIPTCSCGRACCAVTKLVRAGGVGTPRRRRVLPPTPQAAGRVQGPGVQG